MERKEIEKIVKRETAKFIKEQLDGRFKEFVSDEFIQVYLEKQFMIERHRNPKEDRLSIIAYNSAIPLFEQLLEGGCGAICNGHHVGQDFGVCFKKYESVKTG